MKVVDIVVTAVVAVCKIAEGVGELLGGGDPEGLLNIVSGIGSLFGLGKKESSKEDKMIQNINDNLVQGFKQVGAALQTISTQISKNNTNTTHTIKKRNNTTQHNQQQHARLGKLRYRFVSVSRVSSCALVV